MQAWREEAIFIMVASLLGDIFGWLTQQDGHIVHDIVPVCEHENASIETGSRQYIMWHNDDAYHPHRADYLLMMCLRNPDATPTTIGAPDMARLDPRHLPVLFARSARPINRHQRRAGSQRRKSGRTCLLRSSKLCAAASNCRADEPGQAWSLSPALANRSHTST